MWTYRARAVILGLLLVASGVQAQQAYPSKPIRLIVPFPAGGSTDLMARMLGQKLNEAFKQPIVVDNRPGGGGAIGIAALLRANADGYTMLIVSAAYTTNAALRELQYDPVNGVTPIALVGETGYVVTTHPSGPINSIKELIAYDMANPGKLNYGSGGSGSSVHFATELFNQMAGTKMTHVPYKGTGAAVTGLLGEQIQVVMGSMPQMIPQVKSQRLRGIAVTTSKRSSAVPDIPTVAETVSGYEAVNWSAVLGPKALPRNVVARWNREIDRILQLSEVKERMALYGMEPKGGSQERLVDVLKRDVAKWQKVVNIANIKRGD